MLGEPEGRMQRTRYIHLIDRGTTIGYQIDDAEQCVRYAVSHKNPRDAYNRVIGRRIVDGRLAKAGVSKVTGLPNHESISFDALGNDVSYTHVVGVLVEKCGKNRNADIP